MVLAGSIWSAEAVFVSMLLLILFGFAKRTMDPVIEALNRKIEDKLIISFDLVVIFQILTYLWAFLISATNVSKEFISRASSLGCLIGPHSAVTVLVLVPNLTVTL